MTFLYIIAAILLFGILITVHEAGHFFASRLVKIPVREFAIGFGPKLIKWRSKKYETEFYLRAIPLGGYCAFYGEDDITGEYKDDPRSFTKFTAWKRLFTIIMGPFMNLVLALIAAVLLYAISGIPKISGVPYTQVQSVNDGSPAALAGIRPLDIILTVDDQKVSDNLPELIEQKAGFENVTRNFVVRRIIGDSSMDVTLSVTPLFDPVENRCMIGIMMQVIQPMELVPGTFLEVTKSAVKMTWQAGNMVFNAIKNLFIRGEGIGEVTGVVGITKMIVDEIRQSQLQGYLYLMVVISINLGIMNLLIIPGLDGSRILFLLVEAVRGKPIKKEAYVHAAGMVLLLVLMAFITFRDIIRLF